MMRGAALSLILGLVAVCAGCRREAVSAHNLALLDLEGRTVSPLRDAAEPWQVFILVKTDCPISNRYAPDIRRLAREYAAKGIVFKLVYADVRDTPARIRRHLREFGYDMEALRDPDYRLVDLIKARVTPEVSVFDTNGGLRYQGRIDNRYVDFGNARPAATVHDLADALNDLLAGRKVARARTPAVGCFIAVKP